MQSKQELEKKGLTELAILCQWVADNPTAYTPIGSEQASKLKLEWCLYKRDQTVSLKNSTSIG